MAKANDLLTSISRPARGPGHPPGRRALAATLSAALLLTSLFPGWALARERDSEAEGAAPPGAIEGGPDLERGGEETVLEEAVGPPSGGGSEETGEGPPLESEPAQEAQAPPPAAEARSGTAAALPEEVQTAAEATTATPAAEPPPAADEAAPASSAPVENQPLSAPATAPPERQAPRPQGTSPTVPEAPPPAAPPEAPEAPPAEPSATPAEPGDAGGSLAGHRFHTVRPGECLWSIAEALLPPGAANAQIAAEVGRLWRLNAARIGTGDPDLLPVGTHLRLR